MILKWVTYIPENIKIFWYIYAVVVNILVSKYMIDTSMADVNSHFEHIHQEIIMLGTQYEESGGVGTYPDIDQDKLTSMKFFFYDTLRSLDNMFFKHGVKVQMDEGLYYCSPLYEEGLETEERTEADKICAEVFMENNFNVGIELPSGFLLDYNYHKGN